jgi:hypothetical protein
MLASVRRRLLLVKVSWITSVVLQMAPAQVLMVKVMVAAAAAAAAVVVVGWGLVVVVVPGMGHTRLHPHLFPQADSAMRRGGVYLYHTVTWRLVARATRVSCP